MTNAQKFQETFGIYATKMWAMPEHDFLKWLNADTSQMCQDCKYQWWNSEMKRYECTLERCPYSKWERSE